MEKLEPRVFVLENTISTLLQDVSQSIVSGFKKIGNDLNMIRVGMNEMREDVDSMHEDINIMRGDINAMREEIDAIRGNSTVSLETIEIKLFELTIEISKINEVTSYEGVIENNKRFLRKTAL